MTQTVSASDFRQNMFRYFDLVKKGNTIVVRNDKKDETLVQITQAKSWDPEAYGEMLKNLAKKPVFTSEDHPEWATLRDIQRW